MKYQIIFLSMLLISYGCGSAKLKKMNEADRLALAEEMVFSDAHRYWASQFGDGNKPEHDYEELGKMKKIAIVAMESNIAMEDDKGLKGTLGENATTSAMLSLHFYNKLKGALEKKGLEVVTSDSIVNNPEYQALLFDSKEAEVKKGQDEKYTMVAVPGGFKIIGFEKYFKVGISGTKQKILKKVLGKLSAFAPLMHALGVDAVIFVENNIMVEKNKVRWENSKGERPFVINLLAGSPPMLVWSSMLPDGLTQPIDKEIKLEWGIGLAAPMELKSPSLEDAGPSMVSFYDDLAEVIAHKLHKDKLRKE